jgi:hypothetical protein
MPISGPTEEVDTGAPFLKGRFSCPDSILSFLMVFYAFSDDDDVKFWTICCHSDVMPTCKKSLTNQNTHVKTRIHPLKANGRNVAKTRRHKQLFSNRIRQRGKETNTVLVYHIYTVLTVVLVIYILIYILVWIYYMRCVWWVVASLAEQTTTPYKYEKQVLLKKIS